MTDEIPAHPDCSQFAHPHLGPCTPADTPLDAETLKPEGVCEHDGCDHPAEPGLIYCQCHYRGNCPGLTRRLAAALREVAELRATLDTFDKRCADALADEVAVLVRRKVIGSRSPAADALLDYRDPPTTPRADRLAALEAELGEAVGLLGNFLADPDVRVDMDPGVLDHANDLVKRYRAALVCKPVKKEKG